MIKTPLSPCLTLLFKVRHIEIAMTRAFPDATSFATHVINCASHLRILDFKENINSVWVSTSVLNRGDSLMERICFSGSNFFPSKSRPNFRILDGWLVVLGLTAL